MYAGHAHTTPPRSGARLSCPSPLAHREALERSGGDADAAADARGREPDFSFSRVPVFASLPRSGQERLVDVAPERVNAPDGGSGGSGPGTEPAANSCATPRSMSKVVSGAFHSTAGTTLAMGDYFPDLVGMGLWAHGGTAGPFDTGSRVGANVQLFGTVPSPCRPGQYTLGQTVHYARAIFDGVHDPQEGQTWDDVAASGRDASRAPFRQLFLDNGLNISMADPPSTSYGPTSNIEWDRDFVTSLTGPGGTASVNWSTSIRVVNGTVTRNTIT